MLSEPASNEPDTLTSGLVPRPDVVLGQHVAPSPAGTLALRSGAAFAAADGLRIVMFGSGGHGSRPETTVDPVAMAAATVMRLHTIVSREVAAGESAVITIGSVRAGTKSNVIADRAELLLSIRTFDPVLRKRILQSIDRIVHGEALAAGSPREPEIELMESFPAVINDPDAAAHTRTGFETRFGAARIYDPGPVTGSEDVGLLATAADALCVYWLLGGADPALFTEATDTDSLARIVSKLPSNHSPFFAPLIHPTLSTGIDALITAMRTWLPASAR